MEITTILKARTLAMMELDAMNVGGKIRLADLIPHLVGRYGFQVAPSKPEDFDLSKGVKFEAGKFDGLLIESFIIYDQAILVDTLSNTDDSKRIIRQMLEWGRSEFGLTYKESQIRRWGHISDIVFQTDFPLLEAISSPFNKLAEKTSKFTEEVFDGLRYRPTQFFIGHDPDKRKNAIASLTLLHRVNTPHSDNIYFSEAPLPTDLHIQYLQEFEKDIRDSMR